jgi:hypothetical protein
VVGAGDECLEAAHELARGLVLAADKVAIAGDVLVAVGEDDRRGGRFDSSEDLERIRRTGLALRDRSAVVHVEALVDVRRGDAGGTEQSSAGDETSDDDVLHDVYSFVRSCDGFGFTASIACDDAFTTAYYVQIYALSSSETYYPDC